MQTESLEIKETVKYRHSKPFKYTEKRTKHVKRSFQSSQGTLPPSGISKTEREEYFSGPKSNNRLKIMSLSDARK